MYPFLLQALFNSHHLVLAMTVFLCIIMVLVLVIMSMVIIAQYRQRKESRLKEKLDDLVSEISICEDRGEFEMLINSDPVKQQLRQITIDHKSSLQTIRKLAEATVSLKGIALELVVLLYGRLSLNRVIYKELSKRQWHRKAHALQALARFKDDDAVEILRKYINHKNIHVRTEAQVGLVRLKGFDGLNDLLYMSQSISEWQQICLLDELSFHQFSHVDVLKRMMQVHNDCIILLALRIAETHFCLELCSDIDDLSGHPSEKVRIAAGVLQAKLNEEEVLWS